MHKIYNEIYYLELYRKPSLDRRWLIIWLGWEDGDGEEEKVEAIDGDGAVHGQAKDLSATYLHGWGLAGYLEEVHAGDSMDGHGGIAGGTGVHGGTITQSTTHHTTPTTPIATGTPIHGYGLGGR